MLQETLALIHVYLNTQQPSTLPSINDSTGAVTDLIHLV